MKIEVNAKRCKECGRAYAPVRSDQVFCQTTCRVAHHRRDGERGKQILPILYEWRKTRGKGQSLTGATRMLDEWLKEDRERAEQLTATVAIHAAEQ